MPKQNKNGRTVVVQESNYRVDKTNRTQPKVRCGQKFRLIMGSNSHFWKFWTLGRFFPLSPIVVARTYFEPKRWAAVPRTDVSGGCRSDTWRRRVYGACNIATQAAGRTGRVSGRTPKYRSARLCARRFERVPQSAIMMYILIYTFYYFNFF